MGMRFIKLSDLHTRVGKEFSGLLAHFFLGFFEGALAFFAFGMECTFTTSLPRGYIVPHILQTSTSQYLSS
jgi:hypothetical protein